MYINTNISSLFAQRQSSIHSNGLGRSLERLSSGLRVNGAKDDAAGLAIGQRMEAKSRGNVQAARNANDAVSMVQTAEGAMESVVNMLQRVRELAVQAANGSNSASDRRALQEEANQLLSGVTQIAQNAEFNGQKVFSQSSVSFAGDTNKRAVLDMLKLGWLEEAETRIQTYFGITGDGAGLEIDLDGFTDGNTLPSNVLARVNSNGGVFDAQGRVTNVRMQVDMADFNPPNLPNGGKAWMYNDRVIAHEMVHAVMFRSVNIQQLQGSGYTWFMEGTAELIHGADERVVSDTTAATLADDITAWGNASVDYSSAYVAVRYMHSRLKAMGKEGIKSVMQELNKTNGTLDAALNTATGGTWNNVAAFVADYNANKAAFIATMNLTNADTGAIGGFDADGGSVLTQETVLLDTGTKYGDDTLSSFVENYKQKIGTRALSNDQTFQVGAGAGNENVIKASFSAMNASALGVSDVDIVSLPQVALVHIDQAIDYVSKQRAEAGAVMNRLEITVRNLETANENIRASRSRIMDTDFAQETAALTRIQILQQASNGILAQANSMPQMALQLLR